MRDLSDKKSTPIAKMAMKLLIEPLDAKSLSVESKPLFTPPLESLKDGISLILYFFLTRTKSTFDCSFAKGIEK